MEFTAGTSTQNCPAKFTGFRKEARGCWGIWIEGEIVTFAKTENDAQTKLAKEVRRHADIMAWKAQQAAVLAAEFAA